MFNDLLQSSYFSVFLIVALGFMLGRIKIKGLSLDVSAVRPVQDSLILSVPRARL